MPANKSDPYEPFQDPDFGTLQLDNEAWTIKRRLPGFDAEFEIRILADDGDIEPNDRQRKIYQDFLNTPQFRDALQAAYWDYYQKIVVGNYRPQMSIDEAAELAPDLHAPEEIWPVVRPTTIDISPQDPPTLHIWAGANWDPEHGADLTLVHGKRLPN